MSCRAIGRSREKWWYDLWTNNPPFVVPIAPVRDYHHLLMITTLNSSSTNHLLRRASAKDQQALAELFSRYRERLRRMVRLRLDRRLRGRFDSTSVLQQVASDITRRIGEFQ